MAILISTIEKNYRRSLLMPVDFKNSLNIVLTIQAFIFIVCALISSSLLSNFYNTNSFVSFIQDYLVLAPDFKAHGFIWLSGLFTYPLIHFSFKEIVFNMFLLWFFGHILSNKLGTKRVLFLYLFCVALAALTFILSHIFFPVFSGYATLNGGYVGVLGIMTTCVMLNSNLELSIIGYQLSLRQVYVFMLALLLLLFYQNNIAFILSCLASIYAGYRYALHFIKSEKKNRQSAA